MKMAICTRSHSVTRKLHSNAGIGMVHQHFTLAESLTVLDNILLGSESLLAWRHKRDAARDKNSKNH